MTARYNKRLQILTDDSCNFVYDGKARKWLADFTAGKIESKINPDKTDFNLVGEIILNAYKNLVESKKLQRLMLGEIKSGDKKGTVTDPVHISFTTNRTTYVMACHVENDGIHIAIAGGSILGGT